MKKIGISTDSMCDLPAEYLAAKDVELMQFYIHTATGRFLNGMEITSENIVEYFGAGNVFLRSTVLEPEESRAYFEELLTRYDQVIHITTSDKIGMSHPNVKAALALMEENAERVILVNSGSVSAGLGHMVQMAVTMRDSGASVAEITEACDSLRGKISSSFIVPGADYLYRVGYAGRWLRNLCSAFKIHPVLCVKGSRIAVKGFYVGNYEKAVMRYMRRELKHRRIDQRQLFITHAGCEPSLLEQITARADSLCKFNSVTVTKASAFISGCFGPGAVGALFVYK